MDFHDALLEINFFGPQRLSFFDRTLVSKIEYIIDAKHFSGNCIARSCRRRRVLI